MNEENIIHKDDLIQESSDTSGRASTSTCKNQNRHQMNNTKDELGEASEEICSNNLTLR